MLIEDQCDQEARRTDDSKAEVNLEGDQAPKYSRGANAYYFSQRSDSAAEDKDRKAMRVARNLFWWGVRRSCRLA